MFPKEKYDELYDGLLAAAKEGRAPYITISTPVLPNSYMAVKGGYTANIVWFLNCICPAWENALPAKTKELVDKARKGESISARLDKWNQYNAFSLSEFPLISTFALSYTEDVTQMLSQYCSWVARQAQPDLEKLVQRAEKKEVVTV